MKSIIVVLLLFSHAVVYSQNVKEYESGSPIGGNYYRVGNKYDKLNKLKELYDSRYYVNIQKNFEKELIIFFRFR